MQVLKFSFLNTIWLNNMQFIFTVDSNCNEFVVKRNEYNGETGRITAGFDAVMAERKRMEENSAKIGIQCINYRTNNKTGH